MNISTPTTLLQCLIIPDESTFMKFKVVWLSAHLFQIDCFPLKKQAVVLLA